MPLYAINIITRSAQCRIGRHECLDYPEIAAKVLCYFSISRYGIVMQLLS